jgi:hypothetical protein
MDSKLIDKELDLSSKWLRHLREASAKSNLKLICCYCNEQKVLLVSEEALLSHVFHAHPEKVPPKEDSEAFRAWKESLRNANPPSKARYAASLFPKCATCFETQGDMLA